MAAVQATGLVKRFETTCALAGVDLLIEEGEVRGLLGPNGAGKSTLLRVLFGLVAADEGQVRLLGRPPLVADAPALEGVSGFVETPSFYPYLSGRVNLELLAELDGDGSPGEIDQLLAAVGLGSRSEDRLSGYSSGMKQRLAIAAALLRRPRLLLLDEPTSGLDPGGVREIRALVRELSAEGVAILLSSHQIGEVEEVCDSFTMLRQGQVVWDGTAQTLRSQAPPSAYLLATGDDQRALEIAGHQRGVQATAPASPGVLTLTIEEGCLDPFTLALGDSGVAIRRLELLSSPLETMFFTLTGEGESGTVQPGKLAEEMVARA